MKFELDLDDATMIEYARVLGYDEDELSNINKDSSFLDTIIGIIESTCMGSIM